MSELVLPKIFAKDISNLFTLVAWATEMQRHGSYADRHPNLGKMRRCPNCGKRRREFGQRCCNARYATTRRVWDSENGFQQEECPERVTAAIISKTMFKKLLRKGRNKNNSQRCGMYIRQQCLLFQQNQFLLETAAKEMHVKVPEPAAVPAFAEKYWLWMQERKDKKVRRQQDKSRRINRD